jgi:CIC family chloride channel protein
MFVVVGMAATFGAAARVPIASLIMVTEMTGGYQLLPPAAFAVLLSYIIQRQVSAHLKYNSLYEAQVEGRAQSPSRYVEHVELALKLLGTAKIPRAARIGHLDLVAVLDSGIPIQLPGRKELNVGLLRPESNLIGKTIKACYEAAGGDRLEIIAILRDGGVVLPNRDSVLQPNDRLLIIGSRKARSLLVEHISPITAGKDQPPTTESAQ